MEESSGERERRALTVLFCDLVDSTTIGERLELETLEEVRAQFINTCRRVLDRYGGQITEILGDGIVAYFGYSLAREHDASRAVLAGLVITDELTRESATGPAAAAGVELRARV